MNRIIIFLKAFSKRLSKNGDTYPKRLLPKKDSEILCRENLDNLAYLCRVVDDKRTLTEDDVKVSPNAIPDIEIFRLSTNMLKMPFTMQDNYIRVTSQHKSTYYTKGAKIPNPKEISFKNLDDAGIFYFQIKDLQNFSHTIPFHKNQKHANLTTKYTMYIDHKPMIFNYYHYESSVYSETSEKVKPGTGNPDTYRYRISHAMKTKLIQISKLSLE